MFVDAMTDLVLSDDICHSVPYRSIFVARILPMISSESIGCSTPKRSINVFFDLSFTACKEKTFDTPKRSVVVFMRCCITLIELSAHVCEQNLRYPTFMLINLVCLPHSHTVLPEERCLSKYCFVLSKCFFKCLGNPRNERIINPHSAQDMPDLAGDHLLDL